MSGEQPTPIHRLRCVDPATGALAPLLPIGAEFARGRGAHRSRSEQALRGQHQQAVWTGERFVIFRTLFYDSNTGQAEMVAFGRP